VEGAGAADDLTANNVFIGYDVGAKYWVLEM
jgi:hypothetical protein